VTVLERLRLSRQRRQVVRDPGLGGIARPRKSWTVVPTTALARSPAASMSRPAA